MGSYTEGVCRTRLTLYMRSQNGTSSSRRHPPPATTPPSFHQIQDKGKTGATSKKKIRHCRTVLLPAITKD